MQHYVIVDLRQVSGFLRVLRFFSTNKADSHAALVVIGTDCIGSHKSNYHTITTTMAPSRNKKYKNHSSLFLTETSFHNKADSHDIAEILLKVVLNTIILTLTIFLDLCAVQIINFKDIVFMN
jgi:hypothetical protein